MPFTEYFQIRLITIKLTESEQVKINHQIRQVERRNANHVLKHHLHLKSIQNCPDCC